MTPTILVADDDPKLLRIITQYLDRRNWQVTTAQDGEEAVARVAHQRPDLIIADIGMPKMDGYALLSHLRRDPATRTIPFIFLTGRDHDPDRLHAFKIGADDYLTKPCALDQLVQSIETILDRIEQSRTLPLDQIGSSGRIEDVDLLDMIQAIELEQRTGALVLSHGERTGTLYFRDGTIVEAQLRSPIREEPLFRLLGWKTGRFVFMPGAIPERMPITASLAHLLLQDIRTMEDHARTMTRREPHETPAPRSVLGASPADHLAADLEEIADRQGANRTATRDPHVLRIVVAGVARSGARDLILNLVADLSDSRWTMIGTERFQRRIPAEMGCVRISSRVILHMIAIRAEKRFRSLWEQCLPGAVGIILLAPDSLAEADRHVLAFLKAREDLSPTVAIHVLVEKQEHTAEDYAGNLTKARLTTWSGLPSSALSCGSIQDQAVRLNALASLLNQFLAACPSDSPIAP